MHASFNLLFAIKWHTHIWSLIDVLYNGTNLCSSFCVRHHLHISSLLHAHSFFFFWMWCGLRASVRMTFQFEHACFIIILWHEINPSFEVDHQLGLFSSLFHSTWLKTIGQGRAKLALAETVKGTWCPATIVALQINLSSMNIQVLLNYRDLSTKVSLAR
jgi:hypothetical protein